MARMNPPRGGRAQKIIAILEKSAMIDPVGPVSTPQDLLLALNDYIGKRASEVFVAVYMNVQNHIVGFSEYTMGSNSEVAVNPTGVFRDALLAGASAILTAHQHPSGSPRPSDADEQMWERLRKAGEILGIPVIDNFVLGEHEAYSEAMNERISYARLGIMKK